MGWVEKRSQEDPPFQGHHYTPYELTADIKLIARAQKRLNYEALCEVLTYAILHREQTPNKTVKAGIACREIEEELLLACKKLGVTVFHVMDGKVQTFEP